MSIGSILNMARSGMAASQASIQTASQNISNAQTAGYSRQSVDIAPAQAMRLPYGWVGAGVTIGTISRTRDILLDATYRGDSAAAASAQTTSDALDQIQAVFGEPRVPFDGF